MWCTRSSDSPSPGRWRRRAGSTRWPRPRRDGLARGERSGNPSPGRPRAALSVVSATGHPKACRRPVAPSGTSGGHRVRLRRGFQLPTSFVRGAGWVSGRIRPNGMAPRPLAPRWLGEVPMARDANAWIDREIAGCRFADERLGRRLRALLVRMAGAMGGSIPLACQDWANTKAAYRFFSNGRVSEGEILGGHFRSTRDRAAGVGGPLMVLHDTTEFSYRRRRPERVGQTCRVNSGKDKQGRYRQHTV